MVKRIFYILGGLLLLFAGYQLGGFLKGLNQKKTHEEAVVLLENIKKVTKLVAVEGYFSEVYDYKDYYAFDISPLRKKALVRVKAKVSVGYDFGNVKISADDKNKVINIGPIGSPQILSVDHSLDYYDISQGTFNTFTNDDYNRLNQNAKDFIISKVKQSDLMAKSSEQLDSILETLKALVESHGWKINVENAVLSQ